MLIKYEVGGIRLLFKSRAVLAVLDDETAGRGLCYLVSRTGRRSRLWSRAALRVGRVRVASVTAGVER
jgi:hypothetical protein